ncbi:MAG: 50S ribosomal protein L3 [Peptococcaceae bacterium]|nr:50S ribosomal protein L3 [Peptococcaceae bacterium]
MKKAILGTKLGMLQIFDDTGRVVPVTVVKAGPCIVTQKKTKENDGYEAIQVGYIPAKDKRLTKPLKGHFAKQGVSAMRHLREFRLEDTASYELGNEIKADIFSDGDLVDVSGVSKGKGFQGSIKRHGFSRGPMQHGSKYHRRNGSLGAKGPARVLPGRKGPGRMGGDSVTIQGLHIVRVDADKDLILIKGAIPGAKKAIVLIQNSIKKR